MCYSATSSFGTFIFVFIICSYLYSKGNKIQKTISIILFFISFMQVLEGLIWLNIDCGDVNRLISSFIPVLLFLQPIITIGTIYMFGTGILSSCIYMILLGIWLLLLPFFIDWMKDGIGKCTTIGQKGHLTWPFANSSKPNHLFMQTVYSLILGIGFFTLNTKWYGYFYGIMAIIGNYISKSIYGHSWGSIWCHFVNILAIGALFI
jgi:hypothetical protein